MSKTLKNCYYYVTKDFADVAALTIINIHYLSGNLMTACVLCMTPFEMVSAYNGAGGVSGLTQSGGTLDIRFQDNHRLML